nr:hypothetical protein [Tanacetum cinerariifolium]
MDPPSLSICRSHYSTPQEEKQHEETSKQNRILLAAGETLSRLRAFKRDDKTDPTGDAFTSCNLALLKEPETFEELKVAQTENAQIPNPFLKK